MKFTFTILTVFFLTLITFAQSTVTIKINANVKGKIIPPDFIGESFETASIRKNNRGVKGYFFDSTNKQLLTLFRELGIKNLRIGGGTVDNIHVNPTKDDIDALFRFAKAADVKVIYSLRLRSGNAELDASIAKYVWNKYKNLLECFAIGNEPDWHSFHIIDPQIYEKKPGVPGSAYPSFLKKWRRIARTILDSVPGAKFTGPDMGSNYPIPNSTNTNYGGKCWTVKFAEDERNSGIILFVSEHNYVGQDAEAQQLTPKQMVNQMLSRKWDKSFYPVYYNACCTPALPEGVGYRLTESNSFSGGVKGGSNCFATALFALDYLHWWAEHNCLGVNYHSTQWRYNATFYMDKNGNYHIYPMGYGIKAFDIGGRGMIKPLLIVNPGKVNLTAYAVQDSNNLFVTVINKEHGAHAKSAKVIVNAKSFLHVKPENYNRGSSIAKNLDRIASTIFLTSPNNDAFSTNGILLGSSQIKNSGKWKGKWENVNSISKGLFNLEVPACSAAIIKISKINPGE